MFKVTTHQPNKVIGQEFYANKILAMIRRDMINASCDEFTGATIVGIVVADLKEIKAKEIKLSSGGPNPYEAEYEITIDDDLNHTINFEAENTGNPEHAKSDWDLFNFSFHDYETATDYENVKMAADTIKELKELVDEEKREAVEIYAKEEDLNRW